MATGFNLALITKATTAALGAGLASAVTALQDGNVEGWEWATIFGAALVALAAVFQVSNLSDGVRRYSKAILGGLIAAVGVVATALADGQGITANEWVGIALAALTALKVLYDPNATETQDTVVDVAEDDEFDDEYQPGDVV